MINEKYGDIAIGLFIFAAVFVVYLNTLGNGFVWDDDVVILANSSLKGSVGSLFSGIDVGRLSESTPYYRPLTLLTFMLEGRLHDFTPTLVRAVAVLLHCLNSYLVFRLVRTLGVDVWGALLAGLLFAVHPVNSESVNFNSGGRNTMLAVFFVLCSYLVHRRSLSKNSTVLVWAGAVLFLAGLFSKETALAILPLILFNEYDRRNDKSTNSRFNAVVRCLPYLLGLAFYLFLRNSALSHAGVSINPWPGLMGRLLDNAYIIPRYGLNVVWPLWLSPQYFIPEDLNLYALPLVGGWLVVMVALWWVLACNCSRVTLFGLAWMIVFWLPVSGLFPFPSASLADRYFYAPG